jgi:hypothetical protein
MLNRVLLVLLFGLSAASLALHFAVECELGILEGWNSRLFQPESNSHSEDNFTPGESSQPAPSQPVAHAILQAQWRGLSLPLAPIFEPPKSF